MSATSGQRPSRNPPASIIPLNPGHAFRARIYKEMLMKTYRVLSPIEFGTDPKNVKRYEVGESIELDDKTSEQLLAFGAIGEAPAEETAAPAPVKAKR